LGTTTISFDCPLPPWLVGAIGAAILVTAVIFIRRDTARLRPLVRGIVLSLAILAVLMVTGLVLNPKLTHTRPDPSKPRLVILGDATGSMMLKDTYTGKTAEWLEARRQAQKLPKTDAWRRDAVLEQFLRALREGPLAELEADFDVAGMRFASAPEALTLGTGAPEFKASADGRRTDLGKALRDAVSGGDRRPAILLLVSEGGWNTGQDPTEVAKDLGFSGLAVWTVGVGDPNPPRDVSVRSLRGPQRVVRGDEILLTAEVVATDMSGSRLMVELLRDGRVVDRKPVLTLASGRPVSLRFAHKPTRQGRLHFTARVAAQEGEQETGNNEASTHVDVEERLIRILLVDSEPRWEFRYIRNVMERDPSVKLKVALFRPGLKAIKGPEYLTKLPTDQKGMDQFDLVILGDVPRLDMPDAFLKELARKVRDRGGALMVVAGRHGHYLGLVGTPVAELLPVTLRGAYASRRSGAKFRPELTQDGQTHLLTRLAPRDNDYVWRRLPPMSWAADVGGLAPRAKALLVHPYRLAGASKLPLLAVTFAKTGKVIFSGVDDTWRWRREVGDKYHYRFWGQLIRWMVKRRFLGDDPRGQLSIDRTGCWAGESVEVQVSCCRRDGFPLTADATSASLQVVRDGKVVELLAMQPTAGDQGIFSTRFTPAEAGQYELRPVLSYYGDKPLASKAVLEVEGFDPEKRALGQNREAMKGIATASGGQYLEPWQARELATLLKANLQRKTLRSEFSPCQNGIFYVLLAIVLGTAWLIRKRSGLA